MERIPWNEALAIFKKWRKDGRELRLTMSTKTEKIESPAWINTILGENGALDIKIMFEGQKTDVSFDFSGSSYWHGIAINAQAPPELAEGKWSQYLLIESATGNRYLFAEPA